MKSCSLNMLPQVGVYTLMIHLPANIRLKVGKLGEHQFQRGYYAYTGSALGASSLRKRVARHVQKKKRNFWHIDYLLVHKDTRLEAVIAGLARQKRECHVNKQIEARSKAEVLVPRFGASDCKEKCVSHLLYLGKKDNKDLIKQIYEEICGKTTVINFY